ncbi:MAG: hypothetical protein WKF29_00200 [Thermoleophilaceae bacterium]
MNTELTIRLSTHRDSLDLGRLARLDSTLYDGAQMLLAESGGRLLAAVKLDGSAGFADPFERTAGPLALLELRASQISEPRRSRPTVRRRRGYRAPASV